MRIDGSRQVTRPNPLAGRALVPVASSAGAGSEPRSGHRPRGSADGRPAGSTGSDAQLRNPHFTPILAQVIGGRTETGRPEARGPHGAAARAYGESLKRVHRLAPGSVLTRSL